MDIQFWIWLAIIAISFLARAFKKKPEDGKSAETREPLGPVSFEELLKEIQASKASKPDTKPVSIPVETPDFREIISQEQRSMEKPRPLYVPSERTNEVYEKAKMEAFTRPSLEETLKLSDTVVRYDKFKGYQTQEQSVPINFIDDLHNQTGLKKAFVLNEVLMRKF